MNRPRVLAGLLLLTLPVAAAGEGRRIPRDDGYRGIWFTLGQYTAAPGGDAYWEYGDKYSGGLGTYTAKHVPIAVYAPEVKRTFFCYGGSRRGERYLYNMVSYYDHETDRVPRPVIVHDKGGVDDPHDNASLAIDGSGHLWVYVAGRARSRPGFVYRSARPWDIDAFERMSPNEQAKSSPSTLMQMFLLYRYGVATMDRPSFCRLGSEGENYLRLSTATDDESLLEGVRRIGQAVHDVDGFAEFVAQGVPG